MEDTYCVINSSYVPAKVWHKFVDVNPPNINSSAYYNQLLLDYKCSIMWKTNKKYTW